MDLDINTGSIKLRLRERDLVDPGCRRPIPDPVKGVEVPSVGLLGQDHIDVAPLISPHGKDTSLGREELPAMFGDGAVVVLVAAPIVKDGLGKEFSSLVTS